MGRLAQILISMAGYEHFENSGDAEAWYWANLFSPLSMSQSGHTPPVGAQCAGFYTSGPSNYKLVQQSPWVPWGTAGRCLSNIKDILNFIQANLGVTTIDNRVVPDAILQGMLQAQLAWAPVGAASNKSEQAFALVRNVVGAETMLDKGGGLPGTAAFIQLCPELNFGIVALANSGLPTRTSGDKMTGALGAQVNEIMKELIPIAS